MARGITAATPEEVQAQVNNLLPNVATKSRSQQFCEELHDNHQFLSFVKKEVKRAEIISLLMKAYNAGAIKH
jgi:hypothetical protein